MTSSATRIIPCSVARRDFCDESSVAEYETAQPLRDIECLRDRLYDGPTSDSAGLVVDGKSGRSMPTSLFKLHPSLEAAATAWASYEARPCPSVRICMFEQIEVSQPIKPTRIATKTKAAQGEG